MSAIATHIGIGAAATAAAIAAVFYNPFQLSIPGNLPPPPLPVICEVYTPPDPTVAPSERCAYQGYPVKITHVQSPTPF